MLRVYELVASSVAVERDSDVGEGIREWKLKLNSSLRDSVN